MCVLVDFFFWGVCFVGGMCFCFLGELDDELL